jgi:hypothetical protein
MNANPSGYPSFLVEAGGIEPPSESLQRKASTCLACVLKSRTRSAHRQASRSQPLFVTLQPRGLNAGFAHHNLTSKHDPIGGVMPDGLLVRQPLRSCNRRHFTCLCLFYELAELGMLLGHQLPPSNPLRPHGLYTTNSISGSDCQIGLTEGIFKQFAQDMAYEDMCLLDSWCVA